MNKIVSAFSWMLIHSIWQGLLLAVIVSIVLLVTKKWKAAARYNLVLLLFALMVPVAAFTFIWEWNSTTATNTSEVLATGLGVRVSQLFFENLQPVKGILNNCNDWFTAHEQPIVMLWLIVFAVKLIKTTGELFYHQQMKKRLVVMPDQYWKERLQQLRASLHIDKTIVLLESIYLKIPVVIGHIKPVILMPAGLLMSLPPDQAEAILLHELAHIKRNDYLINFLQYAAETIFFFNPALLWVSRWIREERENCCDDTALEQTQNNIVLAEALISFKQHQLYGHAYQTAFAGKNKQLLRRVSRILGKHDNPSSISQKLFFAVVVVLLLTTATAAMLVQARETTKAVLYKVNTTPAIAIRKKTTVLPVLKKMAEIQVQRVIVAATKKVAATEKTISINKNTDEIELVIAEHQEPVTDDQRIMRYDAQAKKDQEQAMKDQGRAKLDQEQAMRDQKQAMLDQQQAEKDQIQAKLDQEQAMRDEINAKQQQEKDSFEQQQQIIKKKEAKRKFKNRISL